MKNYVPPTPEESEFLKFEGERMFGAIRTRLPKDWNSRDNFERILLRLDKTSSPGWPLCKEAPTIGKWLYDGEFLPNQYRSNQLWGMVQDVFSGKYFHAFKLFIKQEPHTLKKRDQGRWRLIMMSSLPVQVCWHMAVGHLLKQTLAKTGYHPLRHGMVYYGGGWKRFHNENLQLGRDYALDMSSWDWNSHLWVYKTMRCLYSRLTVGGTSDWESLMDVLFADAFENKRLILPGGEIFQQTDAGGLMPSGLVPTIDLNGAAAQLVDMLARKRLGLPQDFCQVRTGDDALIRKPPHVNSYVSELEKAGCVVKEHFEVEEFMGFEISSLGYFPKYVGKHLKNLLLQRDEFLKDSIDGYLRIYVFDKPMFGFFRDVAEHLGVETKSEGYYSYFATHPDALEAEGVGIWFKDQVSSPYSVA